MSSSVSSEVRLSALFKCYSDGFSDGTSCPEAVMSDEAILGGIDLAKSNFLRGQARLGIKLPKDFIRQQQILAAMKSEGISPHTMGLIDTYKGKGIALDVGCGIGLNSIAILKKGWDVYALDLHKEVLAIFEAHVSKVASHAKAEETTLGECTIINKDITEMLLEACSLDLVLADDVLSYLSPDLLIPTIRKIYEALLPGGIFMGSLLVNRELSSDKDIVLMARVCALNAYSYTDPVVISNIFRYAGFHMEVCTLRAFPDPSHPARIVSFVARKLSEKYDFEVNVNSTCCNNGFRVTDIPTATPLISINLLTYLIFRY